MNSFISYGVFYNFLQHLYPDSAPVAHVKIALLFTILIDTVIYLINIHFYTLCKLYNFLLIFVSILILSDIFIQKNKYSQEFHRYNQYLENLNKLIQKTLASQHEYDNRIQSLINTSENTKNYKKLLNELQKSNLSSLLKLENKLLAGLLYYKYCQAQEKHIELDISILNPLCKSHANEFELVDSVGILLDNALEASSEGDTIYILINQNGDADKKRFEITVENPGPVADEAFIHQIFKKGYTTKTENTEAHGIGLKLLQSLIKKYHGSILVDNTTHEDIRFLSIKITL